jgi:hypothetical protein
MEEEHQIRPGPQTRTFLCARTTDALERIGFSKSQMSFQDSFCLRTDDGTLEIPVEILVFVEGKPALLVKIIDGPTRSREQAAVAIARLHPRGPFPVVLVANGSEVLVIDADTRRILGLGYEAVPSFSSLQSRFERETAAAPGRRQPEKDERILAAYYHLRCPVPKDPY